MTETKAVTSNRDKHLERLQKKYPDKQFADDEAIYGQIGEDYDQYEQELGGYKEREQALGDMFAKDPRSAQFFVDMHKGQSPWASYIKLFGPELKEMLDDPDAAKQIADAETEYLDRVTKSRELDAEYERNMSTSLETLRQFQSEQGLSDDQLDEVAAALIGIVRDGVMGKFAPETLVMILKAINHDTDVANASQEGEVAGRNARIKEQLRTSAKGDGLAPLDGKNSVEGKREKSRGIFGLADEAM